VLPGEGVKTDLPPSVVFDGVASDPTPSVVSLPPLPVGLPVGRRVGSSAGMSLFP